MVRSGPPNSNKRAPLGSLTTRYNKCAERLAQFRNRQRERPNDNNIEFWTNFVAEFFTPNARKRWCISHYKPHAKQLGVFRQDTWNCKLCNRKPGYGYEITVEALPRLFKVKYDCSTSDELLYVDLPQVHSASGYTVLIFEETKKESVFEHLRVVHSGQLHIMFSPDFKIFSWEFCARGHEVLIPKMSIQPQFCELGAAVRKYQVSTRSSSNQTVQDQQMSANMFVESSSRLKNTFEVPELTDFGYMKPYMRCIQTADTVCRMRDVIDYSQKIGKGPLESFADYKLQKDAQKSEEKQTYLGQNANDDGFANVASMSNDIMNLTTHGMVPICNFAESFADYKLQNDAQKPEEKQTFMGQNANDDRHANVASMSNDIMNLTTQGTMPTCNSATTLDSNFSSEIQIPNCLGAATPVPIPYPEHSIIPPAQGNPSTHFMSQPPSSSNNPSTSKGKLTSSAAPYQITVRKPPAQSQFQRQPSSSSNNPSDVSKSLLESSAAEYVKWYPAQFQRQPSSQHKTLSSHWNSSTETTVEALPRLFKLKYDSGTLEELLHVDMPREYQNASGHIILEYAKATKESVFEHLRVEHDGQLRIVFSPDLKICSWEFCARSHEVLIPRRSIMPQVSELEAAARNYQICALNASSNHVSAQDPEMSCKLFGESACQLQKALDVPVLLTKLGYMQNYARGLQISDTACRMKSLIDYSLETGKGPMESYANFIKHGYGNSSQKPVEKQQNIGQNMNSRQVNAVQSSASNDIVSRSSHGMMPTCTSATAVDKFPHKKFKNSWQENQKNIPNSPCVETPVQIPSTGSSTMSPVQKNPSSSFLPPPPYTSYNLIHTSQSSLPSRAANNDTGSVNSPAQIRLQSSSQLNEAGQNEFRIYVEKIKQETSSSSESGDAGSTSGLITWGRK